MYQTLWTKKPLALPKVQPCVDANGLVFDIATSLFARISRPSARIGIIGLGYVRLPLARALCQQRLFDLGV